LTEAASPSGLADRARAIGLPVHLVSELASPNHRRRASACNELAERLLEGQRSAIDVLVAGLGDSHPAVRVACAESLSVGPADEVEGALLEALRGLGRASRPGHRASLVHALGLLERPAEGALESALLAETAHPDHDVRFQAVASLNGLGCSSEGFSEAVGRLVRDIDVEVAAVAAIAAAELERRDLLPMVVERWGEARGFAKRHLAMAGAHLGSDAVTPTLLAALRDGLNALDAVDALVALGTPTAAEVLRRAAGSWRVHPLVRARAGVALVQVEHPAGRGLVEKQLAHRRDDVRWATLEWLGRVGRGEWRSVLEQRLRSASSRDSAVAARALALLGDREALPVLREAADGDPRTEVREEAGVAAAELELAP
jgi:HEAT repeat protein